MTGPQRWRLRHRRGTAAALLAPWPPEEERHSRQVAVCQVQGPSAVVLGSTQHRDLISGAGAGGGTAGVDAAASGGAEVDPGGAGGADAEGLPVFASSGPVVVRRRTGGGAVWVAPGAQAWVDVWVPRGDPLWDDDVVVAGRWIGAAWRQALLDLGVAPGTVAVHQGRLLDGPWSAAVCFAGVGPGEVLVDGRKLVGLAQRRTRHGAWFHTSAHWRWDPAPLVAAFARRGWLSDGAARAEQQLRPVAVGLADVVEVDGPDAVAEAVAAAVVTC